MLGSILLDNASYYSVRQHLHGADDFTQPFHRAVFAVIEELLVDGSVADVVTIASHLGEKSLSALTGLPELIATAANAEHYASIVAQARTRREMVAIGQQLIDRARSEDVPQNVIGELSRSLAYLLERTSRGKPERIGPIADRVVSSLEEKSPESNIRQLGMPAFDRALGGVDTDWLVVLGARPSMGKTAFALQSARAMAKQSGAPAMFFSLESKKEELVRRVISQESGVPLHMMRTRVIDDFVHWQNIHRVRGELECVDVWIDDTDSGTVADIRAKVRSRVYQHGPVSGIFVDYLQLLPTGDSETRDQGLGEVARDLKRLAREVKAPVMALSQLNRAVEARASHRPSLSDLRESGNIEAHADAILFLHRESMYSSKKADDEAELIVGKFRDGERQTIAMNFDGPCVRFS